MQQTLFSFLTLDFLRMASDKNDPDTENLNLGSGIPKLILPPAIPVRPPKYTYAEYEEEYRVWKKSKRSDSAWKDLQWKRWREGFRGLTGIHYFYLTQVKIKDALGNPIRPTWRDVDDEIFQEFDYCYKNKKDLYVFKRREVGLSSIFGGVIPLWMLLMNPNSNSAMTSADIGRVSELTSSKLIFQHAHLFEHDDWHPKWHKPKRKTYDPQKGATFTQLDEDERPTGNESQITCRQTSQDAKDVTNLEGPRLAYVFLDELFQHPRPQDVRGSVTASMKEGFSKAGILVAGGSAGSITRLGGKEARRIVDQANTPFLKMLFVRGTKGISKAPIFNDEGEVIGEENFCVNGWSDEARAETWIRWYRSILDLSPDKKTLNWTIKQYPLDMNEVLQSDELGVIPKDIADLIPAQERELENRPRNIRRGKFDEVNGKATFINASNGDWVLLEDPVPGELYDFGTDAIPMMAKGTEVTNNPDETDRSMHCTVIRRRGSKRYVAIYLKRTSNVDIIFEQLMFAHQAFNGGLNMIERNSAALIYDRYSQANALHLLAPQPAVFGGKGFKRGTVRGIYKDGNNTERIYNAGFDYFREHMENVDFPIILEQLRVFGQENTDVIDAIMMCEVRVRTLELSDGKKAQMAMEQRYREVPVSYWEGGNRKVRYIKQPIDANGNRVDLHEGMKPLTSLL